MRLQVVLGWVVLPLGCGASVARKALARGVDHVGLDDATQPPGRPALPAAEAARSTGGHH